MPEHLTPEQLDSLWDWDDDSADSSSTKGAVAKQPPIIKADGDGESEPAILARPATSPKLTRHIVFDIETGALTDHELDEIRSPFDISSITGHPGEFHESDVKTGNIKDAAKIKAKIEKARQDHEEKMYAWQEKAAAAEYAHIDNFRSKAALHPLTGRVLAIGYRLDQPVISAGSEEVILRTFWERFEAARDSNGKLIGFNISGFDVPFLVRRSWINGIIVPAGVFDRSGRYLAATFVDLYERWKCGARWDSGTNGHISNSLDTICRCMGIGGKTDGVTGGDFARLWFGPAEDKAKAQEYLRRELEITWELAKRMGVM